MAGLEEALFLLLEKKDEIQHWLQKQREKYSSPYLWFIRY